MNLVICENRKIDQEILTVIFEHYITKNYLHADITCYHDLSTFYEDYQENFINPDILVVNMDSPTQDCIMICKKLRDDGFSNDIILTSINSENSIKGYEIDAHGFLLKPYITEHVFSTLKRILECEHRQSLLFRERGKIFRVPLNEITYLESQNTKCFIHCRSNIIHTIYKKLNDVEHSINDPHFIRCHQSYLVNMDYIVSASSCFQLTTGEQIPIRTREIKRIKDLFYIFAKANH